MTHTTRDAVHRARRWLTLVEAAAIAMLKADAHDAHEHLTVDLHALGDALQSAAAEAGRALDEALASP